MLNRFLLLVIHKIREIPKLSTTPEVITYGTLCLFVFISYLVGGFVLPSPEIPGAREQHILFGFSQLSTIGICPALFFLILPFFFVCFRQRLSLLPNLISPTISYRLNSIWIRVVISIGLSVLFFLMRNEFANVDALMFAGKFLEEIPEKGAYVTHDEMWEFYLHSRFWFYTHHYFGWSVKLSYQVVSSIGGGVFVFLLLTYWSILAPEKSLILFWLCASGGYMQLFFGDQENYTLTAVWIMGYLLASVQYFRGRISVVWPSVVLSVAVTFHLLSLFLVPSLLFLWARSWQKEKKHLVFFPWALL